MKSYQLQPTKHPQLYRVVDRDKNWEHYAFIKKFAANYDPEKGWPRFEDVEEVVWLRGSTTILGIGYAKDKFFQEWLLSKTRDERDQILRAAGYRGDMVHRIIDQALTLDHKPGELVVFERDLEVHSRETGEERQLTNSEWDCFLAWGAFWKDHQPVCLVSEAPTYNLVVGYAGTADAVLILTRECQSKACACHKVIGKAGLWDWKTAGAIYPSYAPQTASYAFSDNIHAYLPNGVKIVYTAILRIGTRHKNGGYEVDASVGPEELEYDFNRFKAAKLIADHDYKPFDPSTDVIEVPDRVVVMVEQPSSTVIAGATAAISEDRSKEPEPTPDGEPLRMMTHKAKAKQVRAASADPKSAKKKRAQKK